MIGRYGLGSPNAKVPVIVDSDGPGRGVYAAG